MKKVLLLGLCAVMLSGCYGPFRLTKKLHAWNGSLGNKWANEAVFLVLNILPVYSFSLLGDAVIFNSVEFWTGKNPMAKGEKQSQFIADGDKQAVVTVSEADHRVRLDMFNNYRPQDSVVIEQSADGMVAKNAKGELIASARTQDDGKVVVTDAQGNVISK